MFQELHALFLVLLGIVSNYLNVIPTCRTESVLTKHWQARYFVILCIIVTTCLYTNDSVEDSLWASAKVFLAFIILTNMHMEAFFPELVLFLSYSILSKIEVEKGIQLHSFLLLYAMFTLAAIDFPLYLSKNDGSLFDKQCTERTRTGR